jgi:hypothetical protein
MAEWSMAVVLKTCGIGLLHSGYIFPAHGAAKHPKSR